MAFSVGGECSTSSDAFSSTSRRKYDVFLSFAGKDTRLKFTDHLYAALSRVGIKAFRDNEGIEKGEVISQQLLQSIKDSVCAVVVLSEHYANSTWCLDELQMIIDCRSKLGQQVFPIFYDIDPSDVRHQRKNFGQALAKHEERFRENKDKVENWRNALYEISNLSGWNTRGWPEADLIKNIVGEILNNLCSKLPSYDENLVGLKSRMVDVISYLDIGSDEVHFVGIWGMGGIGKTTLARVVYENISNKFEVCCFLSNVRETSHREGLVSLQRNLFPHLKVKNMKIDDAYGGKKILQNLYCSKKVLLVLDDVDHMNQLQNLAQSPKWFGAGSRVIITTRDWHLLFTSKVQRIYEMKTLKEDESLQLFSNKAFNKNLPDTDYLELSESVVKYAGGLPLALEVLGSFLCGRSKAEWTDALDRLKQFPNNNVLQVLQISYDGLNEEEKTIFLDIACFFKGWRKKEVTLILESCDLHPTIGIKVLIEKTLLVETEDCRLEMHDLLEDLGRYIVHQESPNVGKRSRLWKLEDIKEVLENNNGSEAIRAIVVQKYFGITNKIEVHPEAFSKMSSIILLLNTGITNPLILPSGSKLPGALKAVRWPLFPLEALPLPLDKLVHIEMYGSKIKQLWNGIQFMKKLKMINLSYSRDFTETPDFSGVPYLEYLYLYRCTSLVKVHPSLGKLKELVEVYLMYCENLEILPRKLETNSLKKLDLSWCEKVAVLPEFGEGMKKLSYLDVTGTALTRLPESLGSLIGLRDLNLSLCKILNLKKLLKAHITRQICSLNVMLLTELHLRGCGLNDGSILDYFGNLSSLIVLDLRGNNFVNLPSGCFSSLLQLLFLLLDYGMMLESLPRLPPRLIRLNASCCNSMEPLSNKQLWNLVASLDHEDRGRTKYVLSDEEYDDIPLVFKHIESECLPLRDFCAIIPGCEIPSWFPNKECYPLDENRGEYEIKVNIPQYFRDSEWFGIVVCFHISGLYNGLISWSSKAPEDDDYICKEWAHCTIIGDYQNRHLCIMVLELNEKTCWQHLRDYNNSLHIKLSTYYERHVSFRSEIFEILGCGWRVMCKEEIQEWCNLNDSNQLTQPRLATPNEVKLPWRVFNTFIGKVYKELLIQDTKKMDKNRYYPQMLMRI